MATKPLRRHLRRKPCPRDRVFTRRLIPRKLVPVSAPASLSGNAPRGSFLPSSRHLHFTVNWNRSTRPCLSGANDNNDPFRAYGLSILTPSPSVGHTPRPPSAQEEEKTRRRGTTTSLERGVRSYCFPLHRRTARPRVEVGYVPQECANLVRLVFFTSSTTSHISFRFQNRRQAMRNTHRQSGSVRGPGSDNPQGAHHSRSSRSASIPSNVSTVPMPPHRPGSVSANPHQTAYIPSPHTETAYSSVSHMSHPQQGVSGQYRPSSRNRDGIDDRHDGGSSRRSRV